MKKSIAILFASVILLSFSIQDNKKNLATVDQVEGIYIFSFSKPVGETTFLGTVKVGMTLSGTLEQKRNQLIKKARKEYSSVQGLIVDAEFEKADVISFK